MSAAWDAMIAAELEQGAPITSVPGIPPSAPTPPHVASCLRGIQSFHEGRAFPTLPQSDRGRFSLSSPE